MERMLATPADAEIILKLYQLRTEAVMRQARAWIAVEFWPKSRGRVLCGDGESHRPAQRVSQTGLSYWEMAAAMVLHGAVSAELFVDCNGEGFFLLAKFAHILEAIRQKNPIFMSKTSELINRFSAASQRYEMTLKYMEAMRGARPAK